MISALIFFERKGDTWLRNDLVGLSGSVDLNSSEKELSGGSESEWKTCSGLLSAIVHITLIRLLHFSAQCWSLRNKKQGERQMKLFLINSIPYR